MAIITINGRSPLGMFADPTHDLIRQYIVNEWNIDNPAKSTNPPLDFKDHVRFTDIDYDYFSTYHVMITQQEDTKFDNDLIGQGLIKLSDPVLIEISARRLTYGKIFEELDNIRMEIIRILGQFEADNIGTNPFMSGIHHIEVLEPGDIEPISKFFNKLPRNIWRAQVKCIVHYFISYS